MATVSSTIQLVDKMSETLSKIEGNINSMKDTLKSVTDKQADIDGFSWNTFLANAEAAGEKMAGIGKKMTAAITAPLLLLGKKMYNNSVEYEAAYTAMRKTVEAGRATEEQYQRISDVSEELSTSTPMSYVELMGTAQSAGNAGVAIDQMEDFLTVYSALQYATDQHISGDAGIKAVASFLNITDGGQQNIEQFANSLSYLGVNANSTEDDILEMANRFASAATIAGFAKTDILGMAAAFESVGIRAEAGGSSAGKLIKQMQLAAEVGGTAGDKISDYHWVHDDGSIEYLKDTVQSGLDFVNFLSGASKSEKTGLANELGMTVEAIQDMADSWLLLDQFAEVSGKTSDQFISDWSTDPAQAMSQFFYGLNSLGNTEAITEKFANDANMSKEAFLENLSGLGDEIQKAYYDEINNALGDSSILQTLNNMGLTEIRESNLIAAMATRPEMFARMISLATQGWDENVSMWEQFGQQMETQESQNAMLGNKLQNTMADLGDNLVQAFQPVLDIVNNLLEAFNNLSETDQTNIIKGLGVIALLGPGLTVVGTAITTISKGLQLISGHGSGAASAVQGVMDAANGAGATGTAAETGLGLGAKIVGGATLAGVSYLFGKGIEYRNEHGALGSVEAIQKATADNLELRDAFVEWVASNNEVESMIDIPDLSDEKANEIVNRQQEAINKFFSMDNAGLVQDLYNDWRETNNLSAMDWLLPEDFLSSIDDTLNEETLNQSGFDVVQGLADGVSQNDAAVQAAQQMGVDLIDAANQALGVQSPSTFMIQAGNYLDEGLTQGIQQGQSMVIAAMNSLGNQVIAVARSVLSPGAGSQIGYQFVAGMASGISSGSGAVGAAAAKMVQSALASANSAAGIHSPSKETYWSGSMMIQGYINALSDGSNAINKTIGRVIGNSETSWNNGIWNMIGSFADTEAQAWQDELNDVEDKVTISDADVQKIRTLAEREVINRFTTAEVKVEMNNTNNINSDMDIDGVITRLEERVAERLEAVAEGVYV